MKRIQQRLLSEYNNRDVFDNRRRLVFVFELETPSLKICTFQFPGLLFIVKCRFWEAVGKIKSIIMQVIKEQIQLMDFDVERVVSSGYETYNQFGCHCSW